MTQSTIHATHNTTYQKQHTKILHISQTKTQQTQKYITHTTYTIPQNHYTTLHTKTQHAHNTQYTARHYIHILHMHHTRKTLRTHTTFRQYTIILHMNKHYTCTHYSQKHYACTHYTQNTTYTVHIKTLHMLHTETLHMNTC